MPRKGKYATVTPKLPRYQEEDTYQDKVNLKKDEFLERLQKHTSAALVQAYVAARDEVLDIKKRLSEANLQLEAISQLLVDQFEDEDVTSIKVSGATVRVQVEPYASVKDKATFRRWCLAHGLEESMVLPWVTTNLITKERLLAGEPEPEGVEVFQKNRVVMVKERS